MTAPGSGTATSGGACSKETPCLVCRLKAIVAAQGAGAKWDDSPFALNMVGVRLAHSISDKFDDRMIAFFSLPAAESATTLKDGKIEDALVSDIAAAASALNGASAKPGRGVRRVPCSAVELEPGKPAAGHRVVAMFPITTDPGLVRLPAQQDKEEKRLEDAVAAADAQLKLLKDSKKTFEGELVPALEAKGKALEALPRPAKGQPKTPERIQAETELQAVKDKINALAVQLKWRSVTSAELDRQIAASQQTRERLDTQLQSWRSGELTEGERNAFEGYRYAFRTEFGWEGDDHALFPLGHHADRFLLYLHHASSQSAAPALTVGVFLGERVITGKTLKKDFVSLMSWPQQQRVDPVTGENKRSSKALEKTFQDETRALDRNKAKPPPGADTTTKAAIEAQNKKAKDDLVADQSRRRSALLDQNSRALDEASREYLTLVRARQAAASPPPGALVVLGCEVKKPDGTAPLADDDLFEITGDPRGTRAGRELRLHYYALAKTPAEGLEIHAHHPAGDRPALPAGSKIVAKGLMYESAGKLLPLADDDVLEVQAKIGGTNVHRGHNLSVQGGAVSASSESLTVVHNWSTGCQVFGLFADFNLFILLAGLSKRWRCLRAGGGADCPRIESGTETAPDPFVWAHTSNSPSFPPDALTKKIKADTATLQASRKSAQADVKAKVDAWYKAHTSVRKPSKDAAAEQGVRAWYTQQLAELDAKISTQKAAVPPDAAAVQELQTQRDALAAEGKAITDAADSRDGIDARITALAEVQSKLPAGGSATFAAKEATLNDISAALTDAAARFSAQPEAKSAADAGKQAVTDALTAMKKDAYVRAVKMKHDWLRTCDLATTCPKRTSYTLIELPATDPTGKAGVDGLDSEFVKKVDGAEVYPKWQGFGAT